MKAAFACRDQRIAPVFDIARRLHLVEVESGRIVKEAQEILPDDLPVQKALRLAELGVGTIFQVPNPLPMSIFRNVAFPLRLAGTRDKDLIRHKVEQTLRKVRLWDEVESRLSDSALSLPGGQQQRMCLARAIILEPEVLLLDEPTSSLDHKTMEAVEQLFVELKDSCTQLVVSHYLDQVKRIADRVVELRDGVFPMDRGSHGLPDF